jgi:hypothetical protein
MSVDANNSLYSGEVSKNSEAASRAPFMMDLLTPWFTTWQHQYRGISIDNDIKASEICWHVVSSFKMPLIIKLVRLGQHELRFARVL